MDGIPSSMGNLREDTAFFSDPATGLRSITVMDDARLGPAVGACRSRPYHEEERALADALGQARTTSVKALIAGLPLAGGCSVLLADGDDRIDERSALKALGHAIQPLDGRYHLMPDLQGTLRTMDHAASVCAHVLGRNDVDVSEAIEASATGHHLAIRTAVRLRLGRDDLTGVRVGIVGLGDVGFALAARLRQAGARLKVADRDPRRTERAVRELGIGCVTVEEIIQLDLDVLAPTTAKGLIDDWTLPQLSCTILAGAVDEPLKSPAHGQALHQRGILYLPDTVINVGGLISLVRPLQSREQASLGIEGQLDVIGDRLDQCIARSLKDRSATNLIAVRMADEALTDRLHTSPERLTAGIGIR